MKRGLYRHFKGFLCEVIGVGKHSETEEELVIYRHDGKLWVRPLAMFNETVERDGKTLPRVTYLGKLVRDNIPAIIRAEGRSPDVLVANTDEYKDFIKDTLAEEVDEFRASGNAEELVDMLEVAAAAIPAFGIDGPKMEQIMEEKRNKRGGFGRRFILRS